MEFVAIDVETANASMASICQIGIASYRGGTVVDEWKSYIDPEDYFSPINVSIHGIDESMVSNAPTLPEAIDLIRSKLSGEIVVCHTHFDRTSIIQSFQRYNLQPIDCTWLDSALVARRAWEEFSSCGYGLKNVCDYLGYKFGHHDALEDAKAAGHILVEAIKKTGFSVEAWLARVKQPINRELLNIIRQGNTNGPLYGEVLVFTGKISIPRHEAADIASSLGCEVTQGVTKNTTIVVVGDQDLDRLAGKNKSSKHLKAEKYMKEGYPIRIISESDFMKLFKEKR